MTALKRPMASSSVHGSFRMSSSALLGNCAAGVGVLCCWSVAAGDAAWETRARFLGGMLVVMCLEVVYEMGGTRFGLACDSRRLLACSLR